MQKKIIPIHRNAQTRTQSRRSFKLYIKQKQNCVLDGRIPIQTIKRSTNTDVRTQKLTYTWGLLDLLFFLKFVRCVYTCIQMCRIPTTMNMMLMRNDNNKDNENKKTTMSMIVKDLTLAI